MAGTDGSLADGAMARLLAWTDGIDLPMFVLCERADGRLDYVHVNGALGRAAGAPVQLFAGHRAQDIFPARMAAQLEENYRRCLSAEGPTTYEECLMIDGREMWWQTTLSKPEGFGGRVILGVAIPVTEAKRREFEAAKALAEMSARFDELRLFSTMAAHDARSPLATVSSLIELVLEEFQDMGDGKADLLRLVCTTVDEALAQISSTLIRGRELAVGQDALRRVDLGRLCGNIATMVDPEMRLQIALPQGVVHCDEVVAQMGVRNLMSNAARYCEGRIGVTVRADAARRMLVIEVSDDGPGLPDGKTLQGLIEDGKTREGAHGFGLSAIAQLLGSRGGSLEVVRDTVRKADARDLSGARFRMSLPGWFTDSDGVRPGKEAQEGSTGQIARRSVNPARINSASTSVSMSDSLVT